MQIFSPERTLEMQIIRGTTQFSIKEGTAIAIGKFDGIHIGHRKLLDEILKHREDGLKATVFTFDPSPEVFFGSNSPKELTTNEEKRELFRKMGIDILVEFPFNKETAAISPEDFVTDILCRNMNAKFVASGSDLSFGAMGKGDYALLSSMGRQLGFATVQIDKIERNGKVISSTLIRELVKEGNMEEAAACLGSPYSIFEKIVHGKALGRKLGIPTLNQTPPPGKLLPPFGVYYSEVHIGEKVFRGMTNIGTKPTVSDENRVSVETFLYDFSGDLYGETAEVSLLTHRRPERHFAGIEELQKIMQADIEAGRLYHEALVELGRLLHL